ncbi:hypothetical protein CAPTEDRAFT_212379 [Capitella teleta]|uniref:Uncharacterized protein n=1 Tax=Capitella teleta TaxID=283909 RepID=R7UZ72_CAPTE|nr:hypothetical protein CAPTEDRAFT_212379 [Capitella teleta]|eukprot:ELU08716.1 hypothetical protein CAPTEDRAFT_212379 [Capitella teleta]
MSSCTALPLAGVLLLVGVAQATSPGCAVQYNEKTNDLVWNNVTVDNTRHRIIAECVGRDVMLAACQSVQTLKSRFLCILLDDPCINAQTNGISDEEIRMVAMSGELSKCPYQLLPKEPSQFGIRIMSVLVQEAMDPNTISSAMSGFWDLLMSYCKQFPIESGKGRIAGVKDLLERATQISLANLYALRNSCLGHRMIGIASNLEEILSGGRYLLGTASVKEIKGLNALALRKQLLLAIGQEMRQMEYYNGVDKNKFMRLSAVELFTADQTELLAEKCTTASSALPPSLEVHLTSDKIQQKIQYMTIKDYSKYINRFNETENKLSYKQRQVLAEKASNLLERLSELDSDVIKDMSTALKVMGLGAVKDKLISPEAKAEYCSAMNKGNPVFTFKNESGIILDFCLRENHFALSQIANLTSAMSPEQLEYLENERPHDVVEALDILQNVCSIKVRRGILRAWIDNRGGIDNIINASNLLRDDLELVGSLLMHLDSEQRMAFKANSIFMGSLSNILASVNKLEKRNCGVELKTYIEEWKKNVLPELRSPPTPPREKRALTGKSILTNSSTGLDCVDLKTNPSTLTAEQLRLISSDALQGYATCLEALNTDGYDRTKLNYLSETVQQAISTPNAWSKQELEKLGVVLIGFSASIIGDIATEKVSEEEVVNSIGRHWISQPDDEIRSRYSAVLSLVNTAKGVKDATQIEPSYLLNLGHIACGMSIDDIERLSLDTLQYDKHFVKKAMRILSSKNCFSPEQLLTMADRLIDTRNASGIPASTLTTLGHFMSVVRVGFLDTLNQDQIESLGTGFVRNIPPTMLQSVSESFFIKLSPDQKEAFDPDDIAKLPESLRQHFATTNAETPVPGNSSTSPSRSETPPPSDSGSGSTPAPRSETPPPSDYGSGSTPAPRSETPPPSGSGSGSTPAPRSETPPPSGSGSGSTPAPRSETPPPSGSGSGSTPAPKSETPPPSGSGSGSTPAPKSETPHPDIGSATSKIDVDNILEAINKGASLFGEEGEKVIDSLPDTVGSPNTGPLARSAREALSEWPAPYPMLFY